MEFLALTATPLATAIAARRVSAGEAAQSALPCFGLPALAVTQAAGEWPSGVQLVTETSLPPVTPDF